MSTKKKEAKVEGKSFFEGLENLFKDLDKDMKNMKFMAELADNAFECSTEFTKKVATRFNGYFSLIFVWLIAISVIVLLK